jgi:cysteine desulfurase
VQQLAKRGFQIDVLRVDPEGQVPPAVNKELLSTKTRLMTMMLVNNETGMIQPVRELVDVARAEFFHCDAVQAVGKLRVRFHELGVSSMSVSAHKFHGPRGVGALLLRRGTRVSPQLYGGHQQAGLRPGTEPVALAVGMAKALELATQQLNDRRRHILMLRGRLLERLRSEVAPVHMHGNPDRSVPHIVNVALPGCPGDVLLMKLDLAGVACSTGSACSSGSLLPSPVLKAMGCSENILRSALRFSFSHSTTLSDIDQASDRIIAAVKDLRHLQLQPDEP